MRVIEIVLVTTANRAVFSQRVSLTVSRRVSDIELQVQ
jgi:hypothetical protein